MVLSMTGYGRAEQERSGRDITVEIKSVNSRYFEYTSRMPRSFAFLDDKLKKLVNGTISRGKTELALTVVNVGAPEASISVNLDLAKGYLDAIGEMSSALGVENDVTAGTLTRFSDIFTTRKAETDEEQLWADVKAVAEAAVENFVAMRAAEGEKLRADILSRLVYLEQAVGEIEQTSAERVQKYTEKLYAKLKALLEDTNIDEARILTEAAIFADKTAVDEETARLRSHIRQYRDILEKNEPVGRKLDFLTQELNRETNTIGSKAQELAITRMVVDMKAEIEKIREQIQNIERHVRGRLWKSFTGVLFFGGLLSLRSAYTVIGGTRNEAHQHRLWQHGQCQQAHRHCQPRIRAHQAHRAGGAGQGGAHRRHLWTPHPCGHHHGFRPCDPFRRTARDGGEPSE